jgi:broad-specificity NMP kinase
MKDRILITGVSGVGKTSVGKSLKKMGYESTDIENIDGIFDMFHKGTKNIFIGYDNSNPEHVKNAQWICDTKKLKNLLKKQKTSLAFYSGIASNMDDILPLFNKVMVLKCDSGILNERLKKREGTEDIGNNQEGRDVVLGWKDSWESEMKKKKAIIIDSNGSVEEICQMILKKVI